MKELTQEEMNSIKGGFFDSNFAAVISAGNTALSMPIAVNVGGGQGVLQNAVSSAGNQAVLIGQVA